jgi:hypothetical protein
MYSTVVAELSTFDKRYDTIENYHTKIFSYNTVGLQKTSDLRYRAVYGTLPINDDTNKINDTSQIIEQKTIIGLSVERTKNYRGWGYGGGEAGEQFSY